MLELAVLKDSILYPYFDQLTQTIDLPYVIYLIQIIWMIFQNILVALWLPGSVPIGTSGPMSRLARGLFSVTCFIPPDATGTVLAIAAGVFGGLFVFILAYLAAEMISFRHRRRFVYWILFPSRFFVEVLPHLLAFPVAAFTGLSSQYGISGNGGQHYIVFGLGLVIFTGYVAVGQISLSFIGGSAYLPAGPIAFFSIRAFRYHTVGAPVLFLASLFGESFQGWLNLVVIAIHIGLSVVIFYYYSQRPIIAHWLNCACLAMAGFAVLMDVAMCILRLLGEPAGTTVMALLFALLAASGAGAFFFDRWQSAGLAKQLADLGDAGTGSEDEQFQEFDDLGLKDSRSRALFLLNYAVSTHNMRFYDFTYMKYIVMRFHEAPTLAHCARVISWLPGCAAPLNFLCGEALARRDIGIQERFVLYQLQRIRLLRESSASTSAAEKLTSVRTMSSETSAMLRMFWERSECNLALLNRFARQLSSSDSLWHEAVEDFPNSVQFRDVYITYLIEAATRFSEAVFQKSRADMIENGTDFRIDNCFRRFVRKFPEYLKRGILDAKGNPTKHSAAAKATSATGSSGADLSAGALDVGVEEGLAKAILTQARVRLTVERAFVGRRPGTFVGVVYAIVFALAICIAAFIVVDVYFSSYFNTRGEVSERIGQQSLARFYLVLSLFSWTYFWGTSDSIEVIDDTFLWNLSGEDVVMGAPSTFNEMAGWDDNAMYFNVEARASYERLITSVMQMATDGVDIFRYAGPLFNGTAMPIRFCNEAGQLSPVQWEGNMRTIWTYYFVQTSLFMTHPNVSTWFTNGSEPLCIVLASFPSMIAPMEALRDSLSNMADTAASDAAILLAPLKWALPGGLLVFSMVLFGIASGLYVREVNSFATLLLNLPKSVKRECMKPLRCDGVGEETATPSGNSVLVVPGYSLPAIFNTLIGLVLAGGSCVLLGQMLNIETYNKLYTYLNDWVVDARGRKSSAIEAMVGTLFAVISHSDMTHSVKGPEWDYINESAMLDIARQAIAAIISVNKRLLEVGDDGEPSTVNYDSEIDFLTLSSPCEPNPDVHDFHEFYRCSSALQLMQYHMDTLNKVILDPGMLKGRVDFSHPFGQLVHLLDCHLLPMLTGIDDMFGRLGVLFAKQFVEAHELFFGVELFLMAMTAALVGVYTWTINSCYDVLLVLLRRVSPAHILACEQLEAYLLNKSTGKRRVGLTADERIIDSSADCIICMGPTGVIDMINPAVTQAFGYTPEQLLGQLLVSLLTADQTEKVGGQIKLMADKQSAPLFEGHTACITDDEKEVHCSLSLLAIFEGDEVSSFVAILKDESALIKQQAEAEVAKRQSETLLYQILPRDIVARLNAGEKDISFSIPSVTISFIDIVKFSEYAANLTPQDIMGNLSLIFCAFDEACVKYPLLMKIKLIGDVYMCAGGLFSPDSPPASHAEQMIRFGLDALQVVDDVNVKLTALLAVRIGVNSGGPILAGVLGTDKPAFDIIGDPINVAARLQSTDVPGKIQISETTHALVASLDFQIEPRGEVELKGKGKRKTYLIDTVKEASLVLGVSTSLEDFARFVPGEPIRPN